ncbi:hypothetical protein BAE44_0005995 [Dichanthelium oligosanthes]|uniref:Uncharacterized protein n=1 Tax=Dichanthelium oligosanthes TaxID=888268 RepID=A0A1E5W6F6_9POAL|nr:hypothetical protein BAE44_0005995 [Dichanthelium oligosanthes]
MASQLPGRSSGQCPRRLPPPLHRPRRRRPRAPLRPPRRPVEGHEPSRPRAHLARHEAPLEGGPRQQRVPEQALEATGG